jgi:hypothetical protein
VGWRELAAGRRKRVIVTTIDPITGNRVTDLEHHPFVVEGSGVAAMKIYFESEDTRRAYLMAMPDEPGMFPDEPPYLS